MEGPKTAADEPEAKRPVPERFRFSIGGVLLATLAVAVASSLISWMPRLWFEMGSLVAIVWTAGLIATRRRPMVFYLRWVNPVVALAVLVLCLIASATDLGGRVQYKGFFHENIGTYFLAKGIFCAAALFLLGKILERIIEHDSA